MIAVLVMAFAAFAVFAPWWGTPAVALVFTAVICPAFLWDRQR